MWRWERLDERSEIVSKEIHTVEEEVQTSRDCSATGARG
jgi:hypothetical protein